jgi:hypothetical protein
MPRRTLRSAAYAAAFVIAFATAAYAKDVTLPPSGDNPHCTVTQSMGLVQMSVDYNSPDVHAPDGSDRKGHIWGELVPYGLADLGYNDCKECPWRGGSNENTVFTTSHDVKVEGQLLPAGAYGLHFIPGKDEWTVIFSKDSKAWGSFWYDPAKDQLRVKVKPEACEYREWLTYDFVERGHDHATVALEWENLRLPIKIAVDDWVGIYVANLRDEFRNAQAFTWHTYADAAEFCLTQNKYLADGLVWADQAVNRPFAGAQNFRTLSILAQLQVANGKPADGAKTFDRALASGDATPQQVHQYARTLMLAGDKEGAKRVFLANAKRFPNQWPVNVGLARAASIDGNTSQAIAYARKAIAQAPDEGNRKNLESLIQQWQSAGAK